MGPNTNRVTRKLEFSRQFLAIKNQGISEKIWPTPTQSRLNAWWNNLFKYTYNSTRDINKSAGQKQQAISVSYTRKGQPVEFKDTAMQPYVLTINYYNEVNILDEICNAFGLVLERQPGSRVWKEFTAAILSLLSSHLWDMWSNELFILNKNFSNVQ